MPVHGISGYIEMMPDLQFLINCAHCEPTALTIEAICEHAASLDQQTLLEVLNLARVHAVLPLVYQAIRRHATDIIPKACLEFIKYLRR